MSSIPSNLAASLVQGVVQQAQSAKAQDAARNAGDRGAARMRDLLARQVDSVEDSYETADDHMTVDKDASNAQQQPYYFEGHGGEPRQQPQPEAEAESPPPPPEDGASPGHLDITA